MKIDDGIISYLEELSCLTLSDGERGRVTDDLGKILGYMAQLGELDTDGVTERSHPFDNTNAFRDDTVLPSFARGLILQNAPEHDGEMLAAPQAVE